MIVNSIQGIPDKIVRIENGAKISYYNVDNVWLRKDKALNAVKAHRVQNAIVKNSGMSIISPKLKLEKIDRNNVVKLYRFLRYITVEQNSYENYSYTEFIKLYHSSRNKYTVANKYPGYIMWLGNQIIAWFVITKTVGIDIVTNMYSCDEQNGLQIGIQYIVNKSPNTIFSLRRYNNDESYKCINLSSSINPDYTYNMYGGPYLTKGDVNILVREIEKKYMIKNIDIKDIKLECVKGKDLYNIWRFYYLNGFFDGYWKDRYNNPVSVGFHYFSFNDNNKDAKFILAIYNKTIVGVIKLGVYNGDHQAIAYIDTLESCRNKGIASYMILNINKYLDKELPLLITDETDLGKACHMADKIKASVTVVKAKTYSEALRDQSYN